MSVPSAKTSCRPTAVSALARLAGALACVTAAVGCGGAPAAEGPAGGPGGQMAVPVEIQTLAPRPVERTTEFVGTVRSRRSTTIQPQVEGFVTRILVKSGDRVSPGTPLFDIDSSPQEAAVATLRSQRLAREADAVYAQQQAKRAKALLEVGAISQQELEQAVAQQAAAEAQLSAIDEQIRQQEAELAYYRVVAPAAGVVNDVPVRVGDRVTRSTVLTTIDSDAGLELYIGVPVEQAPQLRVGLPVQILDQTGQTIASEHVSFVAASVDEATQTVLAKAPLTQRDGLFRSDQFLKARIVWDVAPALTIPVVSVIRVSGQHFVYVAEADGDQLVAKQRAVSVGPVVGEDYLLHSGVEAGERLIVSGIQKIADGAPVQDAAAMPRPSAAPADPAQDVRS